jgi:hypothetical protein
MALWAVLDLLRRGDVPVTRYDRLARIGNFQDIARSTASFEIGNGSALPFKKIQKENGSARHSTERIHRRNDRLGNFSSRR